MNPRVANGGVKLVHLLDGSNGIPRIAGITKKSGVVRIMADTQTHSLKDIRSPPPCC